MTEDQLFKDTTKDLVFIDKDTNDTLVISEVIYDYNQELHVKMQMDEKEVWLNRKQVQDLMEKLNVYSSQKSRGLND